MSTVKRKIVFYLALLKECSRKKDVHRGMSAHAEIVNSGLLAKKKSSHLATALLHMYARCGEFARAELLLDSLPERDVVAWNAFISALVHHGRGMQALRCLECMRIEGITPNAVTFISVLKACGDDDDDDVDDVDDDAGAGERGKQIHGELEMKGLLLLEADPALGNSLVYMYVKCGLLDDAKQAVFMLRTRDTITWSILISGYVDEGRGRDAIECFFGRMQKSEGLLPDAIAFASVLSACGNIGASSDMGKEIHDLIVKMGLLPGRDGDAVLSNALVSMYAKCGEFEHAQRVFDELHVRNVASWTALLSSSGYNREQEEEEEQEDDDDDDDDEAAFASLARMKLEGISPNLVTYACVLKACCSSSSSSGRTGEASNAAGKRIHCEISAQGLLEKKPSCELAAALIGMYAACGSFAEARKALDQPSFRDVVMWNAIVSGYLRRDGSMRALDCFQELRLEGLSPNAITFACVLKACAKLGAMEMGEQIHREVARNNGLLAEHATAIGGALVALYARCGALDKARRLLEYEPLVSDVASWNALITAYVRHGQASKALTCVEQMQIKGIAPNTIAFASVLKASGSMRRIGLGQQTHAELVARGWSPRGRCLIVGTALVEMYAACGALPEARRALDELAIRDAVAWNALIAGQGNASDAYSCLERMQSEGLAGDAIAFTCILRASCGASEGERVCGEIAKKGFLLGKDAILGAAVVDMYARSGALEEAKLVVNRLPVRDIVCWSALVAGCAKQGDGEEAIRCFERMIQDGIRPNSAAFLSLLNACSHSGLVREGEMGFFGMSSYGAIRDLRHWTCLVDALGRAGLFDRALAVMEMMPPYPPLWGSLLGSCRKWGNVEVAKLAFQNAISLDCSNAAAYACMASIFAGAGLHDDAAKIEAARVMNASYIAQS